MNKPGRVLWLHTQPEHYHNCMMDDLARSSDLEYIAAFSHKGPGLYEEIPTPTLARTVFLRTIDGENETRPASRRQHTDWRQDLDPLDPNIVIVAGYGIRTHRAVIHHYHRRGIPVLMFSDSNMRTQLGASLKARLKRIVKKRALKGLIRDSDILLTANRLGIEYWKFYGAPAEKLVVCPYYADYERVEQARRTVRAEVFERFGLKPDERLIFTAARLVPVKGLDLSIKAFRASGLAAKGFRYLLAGVGPLEADLKQIAGEDLNKSIRFIGFQQPSDNLALMHHADVFVLPSIYEPHGIVVQESLAAGTPVIASDVVGAAYDLVQAGTNGEIFHSGDWRELQNKLVGILQDSARLAHMRSAARDSFERWFAEYSPIKVVDRVAHQLLAMKLGSRSSRGEQ